jgi:transmembrane sensor
MPRQTSVIGRVARLPDDDAMIRSKQLRSLEREAVEWLLRLTSGDATVGEMRQFESWRRRSEIHAEAYRGALGIWRSLGVAGHEVASATDRAIAAGRVPPPAFASRRMFLTGGLTTAAAAAGVAVIRPPLGLWPSLSDVLADYHTVAGERRTVAVTEQVSAELNTRTAVDRRSVARGEAIELIKGEVAISSTCSADQPFIVLAGGGRTRSARAKFNVRNEAPLVRVICLEGAVQIEQASSSMLLSAGQQAFYSERGISAAGAVDPSVVTAWQRGLLIFRDEELSQVVEEVNRYWSGRIVVLDTELGRRHVTARIELARIGEVISYVQTVMGAKVRTLPGGVVLLG